MNEMPETYKRVVQHLDEATRHYVKTGVLLIKSEATHGSTWAQHTRSRDLYAPQNLRRYMRKVSKELKRPLIIAQQSDYGVRCGWLRFDMIVRKRKYMEGFVLPFLLAAGNVATGYNTYAAYSRPDRSVSMRQDRTNWYITFGGEEGEKLLQQFIDTATANPDYRKAMKLPPLTQ